MNRDGPRLHRRAGKGKILRRCASRRMSQACDRGQGMAGRWIVGVGLLSLAAGTAARAQVPFRVPSSVGNIPAGDSATSPAFGVPSSGYNVPLSGPIGPSLPLTPPFHVPSSVFHVPSSAFGVPSSAFGVPYGGFGVPSVGFGVPNSAFNPPGSAFGTSGVGPLNNTPGTGLNAGGPSVGATSPTNGQGVPSIGGLNTLQSLQALGGAGAAGSGTYNGGLYRSPYGGYGYGPGFSGGSGLAAPNMPPGFFPDASPQAGPAPAVRRDPARASASTSMGDKLARTGNIAAAVARYEQAAKADPVGAGPRLRLAEVAVRRARYADAAKRIRAATAADPHWAAAPPDLAAMYAGDAELAGVTAKLQTFVDAHPGDRDARLVLGVQHLVTGHSAEAAASFQALGGQRPDPTLAALMATTDRGR